MNHSNDADVVILGAGIAGCAAALALADDRQVLLLDRDASPALRPGDCLPAAAGRILRRLGVWEDFLQQPHLSALGTQSYWGSSEVQIQDGLRNPDGQSWHLDRQAFECLLRRLAARRGVTLRAPDGIAQAHYDGEFWRLTLDGGAQMTARRVIDAGGRRAPFVRRLGVERLVSDSLLAAWATYPDPDRNGIEAKMATVCATPEGWWYSSPLPHRHRLMAFHTDKPLLDTAQWRYLTPFVCAAKAHPAMSVLLPEDISSIRYHGITAANSTRLEYAAGPGWAAVGDAALSFDPLSSQGMYNALATAVQLADLVLDDRPVTSEYNAQIHRIWTHYAQHRWRFYGMEKRWPARQFWSTRCGYKQAFSA